MVTFSTLLLILIHEIVNLINLRLPYYTESFYTDIISNQNNFLLLSLQHSHCPLRKVQNCFFLLQ